MGGATNEYFRFGQSWASAPTDGEIRLFLLDQLRDDRFTRTQSIRVRVADGVVTLDGVVTSSLARRAADDDAWATPGVRDVNNHVRVVTLRPVSSDGPRAA
jgi:osmotically-inducible protein OsmY